jgi:hypothetical protein
MLKFIALALILFGVFIGVQYSDEIQSAVNEDHIEQLKDSAETIVDTVEELSN